MILIVSNNEDITTNTVIDWITIKFITIRPSNFLVDINIHFDKNVTLVSGKSFKNISLNEIKSYWYRRDNFLLGINNVMDNFSEGVVSNIENEWSEVNRFLHLFYTSRNSIGSFHKEIYHSKLITLYQAQNLEITIPNTLVACNKESLKSFVRKQGFCISKSIDRTMLEINTQKIGTNEVTNKMIENLDETFFPTLIQKKITKIFELRIFYLKGKFYPMAIFSQKDKQTQLDYRNYNREKPNRNIPFILPNEIERKLKSLMDKLGLNTGSIDMIVTPKGEYVFLEVNPTGQFGWVSKNCNYYLEEKIAHCLEGKA